MGISFSCPFAADNDLENGMESVTVKPISLGHEGNKTPRRSISFTGRDSDPVITKSLGSGKMMVEGSISFKQRQMETLVSINPLLSSGKEEGMLNRSFRCENMDIDNKLLTSDQIDQKVLPSFINDLASPKHEAALKLQKVYKSFRTRRKLADCAVLVEQSWWKLLDFAELKHSSISFFGIEHHETAISRWSRAKTRAAKVGRGLSQNDKAQKLALQHWLEAIDPRHRYGHNLHFYYVKWLQSQSREPFFYWLDIGEGKEVNLEKCPRLKLQQQCIKYLGPMERKAYEVVVEDGKFCYKQSGELLNTTSEAQAKWIFVLSTSKTLYVGMKMKGTFQHSSFLAGGATSAAGRLVVENGILKAVWPHSGHYRPTPENFQDFISYLRDNNVDLTYVKMDSVEEDDQSLNKQSSSIQLRNSSSSEEDSTMENAVDISTVDCVKERLHVAAQEQPSFRRSRVFSQTLTNLQIPKRDDLFVGIQSENSASGPTKNSNMCDEECEVKKEECIPEESILKRINSHKDAKSFQLGKQLSCKWTTGAGPRIGCVRDYPSELQVRALEQVNLSPRSGGPLKSLLSPCYASGSSPKATMLKTIMSQRSLKHIMAQSSPLSGRIRP